MKIISYFFSFLVNESYVFIRTTLFRLLKIREQDRLVGHIKLIVFIEGLGGNWPNLGISKYLDNSDFDYIFLDNKTLKVKNIPEYAQALNQKILNFEKDYKEIVLVGFSLGGITSLYYLNNYPNKIKKLITISTPFGGSYFSYLPFIDEISNDMYPTHKILEEIKFRSKNNKAQVIAASPIWDQISIFTDNEVPSYAEKFTINAIGHNSAMIAGKSKDVFDKFLLK